MSFSTKNRMRNFIINTALSIGFDACGITKAETLSADASYLQSWLKAGCHASMKYLERNFDKRVNPKLLVPGCESIIVVLMNYFPSEMQLSAAPQIAKYAYSKIDYHKVLKTKLQQLEKAITEKFGKNSFNDEVQHIFVDSAPVLERRWAEKAGLGWIGKNKQLIHPGLGSYVFIGILMMNAETEYDLPIKNRCGNCRKCIDSCPTQALSEEWLDANKCISYLTIECKTNIPEEFQGKLSNYAVGCDICADVCPWNRKWAQPNRHPELETASPIKKWNCKQWENLNQEEFESAFSKSAIEYVGYSKLKENISILMEKFKKD